MKHWLTGCVRLQGRLSTTARTAPCQCLPVDLMIAYLVSISWFLQQLAIGATGAETVYSSDDDGRAESERCSVCTHLISSSASHEDVGETVTCTGCSAAWHTGCLSAARHAMHLRGPASPNDAPNGENDAVLCDCCKPMTRGDVDNPIAHAEVTATESLSIEKQQAQGKTADSVISSSVAASSMPAADPPAAPDAEPAAATPGTAASATPARQRSKTCLACGTGAMGLVCIAMPNDGQHWMHTVRG